MSEKPILFSESMVHAILAGKKTQTRRIARRQPVSHHGAADMLRRGSPYGVAGDRLWVRETWAPFGPDPARQGGRFIYRADPGSEHFHQEDRGGWRPSIHMPRYAARLFLDVVAVRVERLQAITLADIRAEGVTVPEVSYEVAEDPRVLRDEQEEYARTQFRALWDAINVERGAWETNPWVWVVEFTRAA